MKIISVLFFIFPVLSSAQQNPLTGNSAEFPAFLENTATIEIPSILPSSDVVITSSVGFEIDTFTTTTLDTCFHPIPGSIHSIGFRQALGFTRELPFTFETDNVSDISALQTWFSNPTPKTITIRIRELNETETTFFNLSNFIPDTIMAGSDGRTSFTLIHDLPPNNDLGVQLFDYSGNDSSFYQVIDKLVEIQGVGAGFYPQVQVDTQKRVITLEMTYNEGNGLITWINDMASGVNTDSLSLSIIDVADNGVTQSYREDFFGVFPFKFEVIYGFGLNSRIRSRIQLIYFCRTPG